MRNPLERARASASIMHAYSRHAGSQLSAAIAYRVLFSLVPFAAFVLTILDLVLPQSRREQFVGWLFGVFPGTNLQESVDRTLAASDATAPIVGLVSLATLLWAASGMMASIRIAFRVIWDRERGPSYARGKLRDLALVGCAGAVLVAAFALSVIVRIVVETGTDLADAVGWTGGPTILSTLAEVGTSTVVVFAALLLLYRFVPPVHLPFASLWPSAAAAAVAFELMAYGYVIYATRFAGFSTVYGPIGVVLGFLVLVYLLAAVILLGAETAAAPSWPRLRGSGSRREDGRPPRAC